MLKKPPSKYPILKQSTIYKNSFFFVEHEQIKIKDKTADYYIIHKEHPGIFIVAHENERILLIKQYRQQTRSEKYEIPAGSSQDNESPEITAKRELQEETGYLANNYKILGHSCALSGFSDLDFYTVLATNLIQGDTMREYSEDIIDQHFFTIDEVKSMIINGDIMDGPTIAALNYFFLYQNV